MGISQRELATGKRKDDIDKQQFQLNIVYQERKAKKEAREWQKEKKD